MADLYSAPDGTRFDSQEELDRAYDIVGSTPNFPEYVEQFVSKSESVRASYRCELGISYGPSLAETLDVFPGEAGGPIVIFVHGGYWVSLTSAEHSYVAPGLVERGATVVVPTYALCPTVSMDEIVRQVRASVVWAYNNGSRYGADTNTIVVAGHSAGGHLAARLLETDWGSFGLPQDVLTGVCGISGLYDLRPFPYTKLQPDLQLSGDAVLRNSPILNIPASGPRVLLTLGAQQPSELVRQSKDYYRALKNLGHSVDLVIQSEFNHFDETLQLGESGSELTDLIMSLCAPAEEPTSEAVDAYV